MVYPDANKNLTHNYLHTYPGTDRVTKQVKLQEHHHRTVMQLQRMEHKMMKWFIELLLIFPVFWKEVASIPKDASFRQSVMML